MSLRLGRVAAVHPEDHSVDLVMIDDGSRLAGVQVLAGTASTNSGSFDLPTPSAPGSGNKWSLTESTDRDMMAVVGALGPRQVVLGFLYPQISQMLFKDPNMRVVRHASDVYSALDGQGNFEMAFPGGAYIRIATDPAHQDLSGKNVDGSWAISKNTGQQLHIHLEQAGGKATVDIAPDGAIKVTTKTTVDIDADGAIKITTKSTVDVEAQSDVTVKTPSQVTVDTPQTTVTGKLTVNGLLTYTAGMAGSGTGPGGKTAQIDGDMAFINGHGLTTDGGDIVAGDISLQHHKTPTAPTGGLSEPIP